jgi:hypothetical protein
MLALAYPPGKGHVVARLRLRGFLTVLTAVAALAALPSAASAVPGTTITVNTGDDGVTGCTLRAAMKTAFMDAPFQGCPSTGLVAGGDDTVSIPAAVDPVITLTQGSLLMDLASGGMTVAGPGAGLVTVSGADTFRVFSVVNGDPQAGVISGITIAQGFEADLGAGINNMGILTLDGVVLEDNHVVAQGTGGGTNVASGGGIRSIYKLTIRNSTVRNNSVSSTVSGGMMTNSANAYGGGIDDSGSAATVIEKSTVSGNTVSATATGSGASEFAQGGAVQVSNVAHSLDIHGTTISGNAASTGSPGGAHVGGLYTDAGFTALNSTTIASNTAPDNANARLKNTASHSVLIADPLGGGDNCADDGGNNDQGFNLEDGAPNPSSCGYTSMFDLNVSNAGLAPLANNGGPTLTRALLPTSPAIDRGEAGPMESSDQRGATRPFDFSILGNTAGGDGSDIGAFELQPACVEQSGTPLAACPTPPVPASAAVGPTGQRDAALKKCKRKKSKKARKKCKKRAKKLPV